MNASRIRRLARPWLLIVAAGYAGAIAADTAPTEAQKLRHDHFHQLGEAFKAIRDQSRSKSPAFPALQKAAQAVNDASVDQGRWFPKGSGPETGKTRALAEVWTKPVDFAAAQKLFADSAPQLLAAVNAGDIEAVRSSYGTVGKSCKNCHDTFRQPNDDD